MTPETHASQSAAGQGANTVCVLSERVWSRKHPLWESGCFFIFWVLSVTVAASTNAFNKGCCSFAAKDVCKYK